MQRPTRDILRISAFTTLLTYSFDVYWKTRLLCKIGVASRLDSTVTCLSSGVYFLYVCAFLIHLYRHFCKN